MDIITLFTLVLLRHQGGVFYYCGPCHTLFYSLSLCDKKGEYMLVLDRECFFNRSSAFVPEWPKGEFVSFWLAALCWQKSLLCNVTAFTGMSFSSKSSRYSEFVIWYGKSLIMTRSVWQASRRNFQTPRRLCNVYSSAKVGSQVFRPIGLVKRLDIHQVGNVKNDAFYRDAALYRVYSSAMFFKKILWSFQGSIFHFPVSHPDDIVFHPDTHQSTASVRTMCHPFRTTIYPLFHLSGQCAIPSGRPDRPSIFCPDDVDFRPDPLLYREASVPVCIRLDVSAARPDAS